MLRNIIAYLFIVILCINLIIYPSVNSMESRKQEKLNLDKNIKEMINKINESIVFYYLKNLVEYGVRYTGTLNCYLAGEYIFEEFKKMGLEVKFENWAYDSYQCRNIVATLPGKDITSDAEFIFCAHYDSVKTSPGASDDGSGVASVLATAKVLSQYNFNHTIKFIAFSGEEVGTYGSFTYARDAYWRGDNIIAVLNADIIGYADSELGGNIIRFSSMEKSAWIVEFARNISEKYKDLFNITVEGIPNYIGADDQAFEDYGYYGVWIFEHDDHQWGHSPNDTIDHINITYLTKITKFLLTDLVEMADKTIDIQVIIKTPYEGRGYIFNKSIFNLDLGKWYFQGLRGITTIFGRAIASCEVKSKEKIKNVVFCVNDEFIYWDSEPPYEWKIQGKFLPLFGRCKMKVFAYTISGKYASDEMDLIIFTGSYQYKKL
jgi:hypothetical protein